MTLHFLGGAGYVDRIKL